MDDNSRDKRLNRQAVDIRPLINRSNDPERRMKDYTRTHYAQSWHSAVHEYGRTERLYLEQVLALIAPQPGQTILECAIGTGEPMGLHIAANGTYLFGVDIAPLLLQDSKANFADAGLTVFLTEGDVEELPYSNDVFDIVYAISSSWYFPSLKRALAEMMRVLKPGGRIIFDIINLLHPTQFLTYSYVKAKTSLQLFWRRLHGQPSDDCVVNWIARSPSQIARILSELPIAYRVKGYSVLLPVSLPHFGSRANLCKHVPLFDTGLQDHLWLKYLGAKLVYIVEKRGEASKT